MKKVIFAICSAALLWSGCTEHNAPIFAGARFVDTIYTIPVPPVDSHQVLVEEFTGQSCNNCPAAHALLESISDANLGRVNIIGLYIKNFSQTVPPAGYVYDFRLQDASTIAGQFGGVVALPIAGIDRVKGPGNDPPMLFLTPGWVTTINNRLHVPDSMNLSISSSYNASTGATIIAKVTYLYNTTTTPYLTIALVEDSMVDKQERPTGVDDAYTFTNVCRGFITAPQGDRVDTLASKAPGIVAQKVYTYTLPVPATGPAIKPEHCRLIAYITAGTGDNYQVVQSAHCNLK